MDQRLRDRLGFGTSAPVRHDTVLSVDPPTVVLADGAPADLTALFDAAWRAPFGAGALTRVDPTIRRGWEIPATALTVQTPAGWEALLADALDHASRTLQFGGPVTVVFDKLVLYRVGDFFSEHRDTIRDRDHVGSLVVVLRHADEGGELVVRALGRDHPDPARPARGVSVTVFHADCPHQVTSVRGGVRVSLVYRVVRTAPAPVEPADRSGAEPLAFVELEAAGHRVVPLLHAYPAGALDDRALRGADRAAAADWLAWAARDGTPLYLANLVVREQSDGYVPILTAEASCLRPLNEAARIGPPDVLHAEVGPHALAALRGGGPREGASWWTGNEGTAYDYRYRAAALVWQTDRAVRGSPATHEVDRDSGWSEADIPAVRAAFDLVSVQRRRVSECKWLFCELVDGSSLDTLEEVDLHGGLLDQSLLDSLAELPRLRVLRAAGATLRERLDWSRLGTLEVLDLNGASPEADPLTSLGGLEHLTRLQVLDLGGCGLRTLPEAWAVLSAHTLSLARNPIAHLPSWIAPALQSLDLGLSSVRTGLDVLVGLPRLRRLVLTGVQGASGLPWHDFGALEVLDLGQVRLGSDALDGLGRCVPLRELHLSGTPIDGLDLDALTALEVFTLEDSPSRSLPPGLASRPRLRQLELRRMPLQSLPDLALPRLESLSLRTLPVGFDGSRHTVPRLQYLRLQSLDGAVDLRTCLDCWPGLRSLRVQAVVGLGLDEQLTHPLLEELTLVRSATSRLPAMQLPNLREMTIADQPLRSLPAMTAIPEQLLTLTARGLRLEALPDWVGACPNLTALDLSENATLRVLLPDRSQCPSLQSLDVSGCGLDTLDASLAHRPGLVSLSIFANPFTDRQAVARVLRAATQLERLELSSLDQEPDSGQSVCQQIDAYIANESPWDDEVPAVDDGGNIGGSGWAYFTPYDPDVD